MGMKIEAVLASIGVAPSNRSHRAVAPYHKDFETTLAEAMEKHKRMMKDLEKLRKGGWLKNAD